MRDSFSNSLIRAATSNSKVCLLTGDHGYALFDQFRKLLPTRYINAGIAEQNMVGVAAGLAKAGFLPVIYGLSAFVPVRVLEQIKLDFCYENLPGIFIGDGAGVVYSHLGSSHQSTEDVACLRALPNIRILSPCDKFEMEATFDMAIKSSGPVYIRMGKADLGEVHSQVPDITWGEPICLQRGQGRTVIFATGSMVIEALHLASTSAAAGATVYSVPSLKPLSNKIISNIIRGAEKVITLEEHSIYGGLGSAVAEIAASIGGVPVQILGIKDRFSEMAGTYQYLMKEHGLDRSSIFNEVSNFRS